MYKTPTSTYIKQHFLSCPQYSVHLPSPPFTLGSTAFSWEGACRGFLSHEVLAAESAIPWPARPGDHLGITAPQPTTVNNGKHRKTYGTPMVSLGKWSTNGGFSWFFHIITSMFVYRRVIHRSWRKNLVNVCVVALKSWWYLSKIIWDQQLRAQVIQPILTLAYAGVAQNYIM